MERVRIFTRFLFARCACRAFQYSRVARMDFFAERGLKNADGFSACLCSFVKQRAAETRAGLAPMVRMDIEECEPAVAAPRASSRRVVCASNSRNFFFASSLLF